VPSDFQRQLVVPLCRLSCATPGDESVKLVVWGEDELGRSVCHARPSSFSSSDAIHACKETLDAYCNFARIKYEKEMLARACELSESFLNPTCLTLDQDILKRESPGDGALMTLPDNFPECDIVIEHD